MRIFGGGLIVALALGTTSGAVEVRPSPPPGPSTADVLVRMHIQNEWEISAGRLAETQGDSPFVRAFGARLASDQTFAERKVRRLARRDGFSLVQAPRTPADRDRFEKLDTKLGELERARGPAFDRLFLATMRASHEQTVALMQETRARTPDRHLKALVGRLIPIHQQHLEVAQNLTARPPRVR